MPDSTPREARQASAHAGPEPRGHRPRVILVPESPYWITGEIAREIQAHTPGFDFEILSGPIFKRLLQRRGGRLPLDADLCHFLAPNLAARHAPRLPAEVARVGTIYHIESPAEMEAVPVSDALMTIAEAWTEELVHRGVAREKIHRVPLGTSPQLFRPAAEGEAAAIRAELGIPAEALVVGLCAKRSSDSFGRKGLDVFTRALEGLRRERPELVSLVIGPGWEDFAREEAAKGRRCVTLPFLFRQEEVARMLRVLDLLWVPSRIEGGPAPLLEAMASGVCCVSTPVGIAPELIRHAENAMLAPLDDAEAFVALSLRVLADEGLRTRMARAARESVLRERRWEQTAPEAGRLYEIALEQCRRRLGALGRAPGKAHTGPAQLPPRVRRWVDGRELAHFARQLAAMGDRRSATALAGRALRRNPLDPVLWWNAARVRFPLAG